MQHLTIATSSGIVWLMLVCHFGAALIALVAGTIALSVAKGGRLHKRSGLVFTCAMIATGVLAGCDHRGFFRPLRRQGRTLPQALRSGLPGRADHLRPSRRLRSSRT